MKSESKITSFLKEFFFLSNTDCDKNKYIMVTIISFLCVCVCVCAHVHGLLLFQLLKLCLTLSRPHGLYSPPDSSAHGISQARILEWVATSFSRGSSRPRDQTCVSCLAGRFFTIWATGKPHAHGWFRVKSFIWLLKNWALPAEDDCPKFRGRPQGCRLRV